MVVVPGAEKDDEAIEYVFAAPSEEVLDEWVNAIEAAGKITKEPEVKKESMMKKALKRASLTGKSKTGSKIKDDEALEEDAEAKRERITELLAKIKQLRSVNTKLKQVQAPAPTQVSYGVPHSFSNTPRILSSHTLLSYPPPTHSSHATLSYIASLYATPLNVAGRN
jgi:hypothetical protein